MNRRWPILLLALAPPGYQAHLSVPVHKKGFFFTLVFLLRLVFVVPPDETPPGVSFSQKGYPIPYTSTVCNFPIRWGPRSQHPAENHWRKVPKLLAKEAKHGDFDGFLVAAPQFLIEKNPTQLDLAFWLSASLGPVWARTLFHPPPQGL